MKVYVLMVQVLGRLPEVKGVYASLDLAVDDGSVYEKNDDDTFVNIGQWDVQQEKEEPQQIEVIYENWGPKIRMGNN
jgi:hypothetical protein